MEGTPQGPSQPLAPKAWQEAEGADMAEEPLGDSGYSTGCLVRKGLPHRGRESPSRTAVSSHSLIEHKQNGSHPEVHTFSSASPVSTALEAGGPEICLDNAPMGSEPKMCVPGLWPKAQDTEETLVSPLSSWPDQRGLPGTWVPRGLGAFL